MTANVVTLAWTPNRVQPERWTTSQSSRPRSAYTHLTSSWRRKDGGRRHWYCIFKTEVYHSSRHGKPRLVHDNVRHPFPVTPVTVLDMPESRVITEWRAEQLQQEGCLLEDPKCWGAWDTICRHKAKDITPSIAWRSETWKQECSAIFFQRTRKCRGQSHQHRTGSRATLSKLLPDGFERIRACPSP